MKKTMTAKVLPALLALALLAGCGPSEIPGDDVPEGNFKPEDPWLNLSEEETCGDNGYWWLDDESEASMLEQYGYDEEFAFFIRDGQREDWTMGLGFPKEEKQMPFEYLGNRREMAEDLAAFSWMTVEYDYYDGFHAVVLTDLRKKTVWEGKEPTIYQNQYLSTTRTDCETNRGIAPGDTVEQLMKAYPEVSAQADYFNAAEGMAEETGIVDHDGCYAYLPEGTNWSILFLTKGDEIVQIDMGDGLDGQMASPAGTGNPSEV